MGKLSELIRVQGWTQKEAAARLGVTQPRISDLTRGKIRSEEHTSELQSL